MHRFLGADVLAPRIGCWCGGHIHRCCGFQAWGSLYRLILSSPRGHVWSFVQVAGSQPLVQPQTMQLIDLEYLHLPLAPSLSNLSLCKKTFLMAIWLTLHELCQSAASDPS
ncbi:uncharacterized protein LOC144225171 [Crocuta crocuta]